MSRVMIALAISLTAVSTALFSVSSARAQAATRSPRTVNWAAVDSALGRTGMTQEGGVRRYSMPRADMQVTVAGVPIRPAFALGSWIAMKPVRSGGVYQVNVPRAETIRDAGEEIPPSRIGGRPRATRSL